MVVCYRTVLASIAVFAVLGSIVRADEPPAHQRSVEATNEAESNQTIPKSPSLRLTSYSDSYETWRRILELEAEIEADYSRLQADGYSIEAIRSRVSSSPADIDYLTTANSRLEEFHKKLDDYFLTKINFVIQEAYEDALALNLDRNSELLDIKQKWDAAIAPSVPDAREFNKLFRQFFAKLSELNREREEQNLPKVSKAIGRMKEGGAQLREKINQVGTLLLLTPQVIQMLYRSFNPAVGDKFKAEETPFVASLNRLLRGVSWLRGYKFEIDTKRKVSVKPPGVEIVSSVHRDIYMDPIIMAHLLYDRPYRTLVAGGRYTPIDWVNRRINEIPDYLKVGAEKHSGFNQMLERLSPTSPNTVLMFPEGTTSLMGEVSPVQGASITKFFGELLAKEGLDVQLTVVSNDLKPGLREGFRQRFSQIFDPDQKKMAVKVSEPFTRQELEVLTNIGRGKKRAFLGRIMRQIWLEALAPDANRLFGQLRAEELIPHVREFIAKRSISKSRKSCSEILAGFGSSRRFPPN